uniref:Uncharacterized protein n=1 Tax=Arundo donax TaxID=35708 RepID=A0A0A8ZDD9_ARUDO
MICTISQARFGKTLAPRSMLDLKFVR